MKKLKRDSSRSVGSVACKRKNNNPRSGCIRPAVVVFAFVLLARNVSGRYLRLVSPKRDKTRSVNSFRGSAKHRFAVNAKTTTRGPDTSAPQSLFSHLYFWLAMFRGVIYVACLALARQDALREQLSRLGKAPLRCKRKNNNPRSGYIRPAVVVFAFMPSAFALPSPCRYFLTLGASIMFIFLPSSFGIISTLANSSRSVAKRSSRISPCSLKTIERPRKKT